MSSPTVDHSTLTTDRQINAYDLGKVLRDDKVSYRYFIGQGSNYIVAVAGLLSGAGLEHYNLAQSDLTTGGDKDWDPGTSKYQIVNELLAALNYGSLSFDGNGVAIGAPYQSPFTAPSIYTYRMDGKSVVLGSMSETLDIGGVPNTFVRYTSSADDGVPPLRSTYTNTNPSSPTSTVSTGRSVVDYAEVADIADQDTLDFAVWTAAQEASQAYSTISFSTGLMPIHGDSDVMELAWGSGGIKYRETKWTMDLAVGGQMQHEVRRVVSV